MTIKSNPSFKKNKVFIPLKQHTFELGMRQSLTKAQKSFPEIQSLVHFKKKKQVKVTRQTSMTSKHFTHNSLLTELRRSFMLNYSLHMHSSGLSTGFK